MVAQMERKKMAKQPLTAEQQRLVEDNRALVYHVIRTGKSLRAAAELLDSREDGAALSCGFFALVKAALNFDPAHGAKFSSYACTVIARAVMEEAKYAGRLSTKRRNDHREIPFLHTSCVVTSVDGEPEPFEKHISAREPEEGEYDPEHVTLFWRAVDRLPDKLRQVLIWRFLDGKTLVQCADALGISKERVRQIEGRAIEAVTDIVMVSPAGYSLSNEASLGRQVGRKRRRVSLELARWLEGTLRFHGRLGQEELLVRLARVGLKNCPKHLQWMVQQLPDKFRIVREGKRCYYELADEGGGSASQ